MDFSHKQIQIIEVAERLFAQKGFNGTSIRDIAQEADINISMVSYYFGSKEKLIEALFELRTAESRSSLETIISNEELSPIQKVNIMIDGIIERLYRNRAFHNIVLREQLSNERTTCISEHILDLKTRNIELMQRLISEGQEKGAFRKDIDISLMTITLFGTINQAIATERFYKKINKMEHWEDEEFRSYITKKLSIHLKGIIKATLSHESNIQN